MTSSPVLVDPVVSHAIASGVPVVALESTIIAHGLLTDSAFAAGRRIEEQVRRAGAVPATIAVVEGRIRVGLDDDALRLVAEGDDVVKASVRDLAPVTARGLTAATTVAATSYLAHLAGIRVFATGGLGGVHRGAGDSFDESADLAALATTPVLVVCAGVKSILDVPATLERLESLSVPVLGMHTDTFPGFYVRDTGLPVPWRVEDPGEVAAVVRAQDALGLRRGVVLANPVSAEHEMDRDLHDRTLAAGLAAAAASGVRGKDVTPYLLGWFHEHTGGASLATNLALVLANAALAAAVAAELVADPGRGK
ncbi:MAG: pseudouridine-5'-phosphate glycosidase [Nocardioidaceae bacterium]